MVWAAYAAAAAAATGGAAYVAGHRGHEEPKKDEPVVPKVDAGTLPVPSAAPSVAPSALTPGPSGPEKLPRRSGRPKGGARRRRRAGTSSRATRRTRAARMRRCASWTRRTRKAGLRRSVGKPRPLRASSGGLDGLELGPVRLRWMRYKAATRLRLPAVGSG